MKRKYADQMHPAVAFFYILSVLIITMVTLNPYLLAISCLTSTFIIVYMNGLSQLRQNMLLDIPVATFTVGIQPIFTGSGRTPLFYVNDSAVCLENYIYGLVIAVLLITVFNWCSVMRIFIDSEKCMYLVGRLSPTLAMMITMILRFIPLMKQRYRIIHEGQVGMGRYNNNPKDNKRHKGKFNLMDMIEKIRHRIKEISILISWSLENSIETSNSMESRGYGIKGRTCYHRYILKKSDILQLVFITGSFIYVMLPIIFKQFKAYYLPMIYIDRLSLWQITAMVIYILLTVFPVVMYKSRQK